jgi:mobilome CxxCx(11)CxxC protein
MGQREHQRKMTDRLIEIRQKKLDNLAAKYTHARRISKLNTLQRLVDFFAIGVPILYIPVRYLAKGTASSDRVEMAWELLAALLVLLVVLKIVFRWQDSAELHTKLMGENISLARQADELLRAGDVVTDQSISFFLHLAEKSDKEDLELVGVLPPKDKQFAYREALKEFNPHDPRCPQCNASAWKFKNGDCQLCGNTPE